MTKQWHIAPRTQADLVEHVLSQRGIDAADLPAFIDPNWETGTHSPMLFTQMSRAVARIFTALEKGEKVTLHGDYDADGVCGSTLLYGALQDVIARSPATFLNPAMPGVAPSKNISVFLPDREHDGYGVAMHTVERLAREGCALLITIDCGIANGLELGRASELGLDVIVCDHHQLGEHYPDQAIVLHPGAPGEVYPNKFLCGTGVAFKLASAVIHEARARGLDFPVGYEKWFLDLVAIATVTDVMPLTGENRVLEHFGLQVLKKTRRPGLRAIIAASGTELKTLDTESIGFRIGPRLNAAGRMASASQAFAALSANEADAPLLAAKLEALNRQRQDVFQAAYKEAQEQVRSFISTSADHLTLSVYAAHWLPGIIGLIAGRLVSDYHLPAFAFTSVGEHVVGSGRSAGGLHLVQAMNALPPEIFVRKGGHPQACGLTLVDPAAVDIFRATLNDHAKAYFGAAGVADVLKIDAEVSPGDVTMDVYQHLSRLQPFGEGNRAPVFATLSASVLELARMGSTGSHLRLRVRDGQGRDVRLVGFGFGDLVLSLRIGDTVDLAFDASLNDWQGRQEVQYKLVDVRLQKE